MGRFPDATSSRRFFSQKPKGRWAVPKRSQYPCFTHAVALSYILSYHKSVHLTYGRHQHRMFRKIERYAVIDEVLEKLDQFVKHWKHKNRWDGALAHTDKFEHLLPAYINTHPIRKTSTLSLQRWSHTNLLSEWSLEKVFNTFTMVHPCSPAMYFSKSWCIWMKLSKSLTTAVSLILEDLVQH